MTPKILHFISQKIEPYLPKLLKVGVYSLIPFILSLVVITAFDTGKPAILLSLWLSTAILFLCSGIGLVHRLFNVLPNRDNMSQAEYAWNKLMSYPAAIFISIWFGFLVFITVAGTLVLTAQTFNIKLF